MKKFFRRLFLNRSNIFVPISFQISFLLITVLTTWFTCWIMFARPDWYVFTIFHFKIKLSSKWNRDVRKGIFSFLVQLGSESLKK